MASDVAQTTTLTPRQLRAWRNAIIAAFAIGGIVLATWGPRLPAIQQSLDLGTGGIGLALSAVAAGSVIGLLSATPVLGRLGARRALRVLLIVIGVALAVLGFAVGVLGSVPAAVAAFAVIGAGMGSLDVIVNVEGAAIERRLGRTLMPLLHASWSAGAIVGSGLGAASAALGIGPAVQFAVEGAAILCAGVLLTRAIPLGERAEVVAAAHPAPLRHRLRDWLTGWADWRLLLIGVVMLGAEFGEGSANNWLTLAMRDEHGRSAAVAALYFTVFAIGETGARVLGGPVVDRFGRVRVIQVTTAIGAVGVTIFILGSDPVLLLVGVLLWAVGVSMGFPLGMSAAAESGPNAAARVSVVASIGYLAKLAGPPAIGFLAQSTGLLGSFWVIVALLVVAFLTARAVGVARPRPGRVASD